MWLSGVDDRLIIEKVYRNTAFAFPMLRKTSTKTQRLLFDGKSSEAHRSISNSKYVSRIRALSYHEYQAGLRRKNDEDFPL